MTGEEWLPVVGAEGWYEVSNRGRVRRVRQSCGTTAGRILRPAIGSNGYPMVSISINGVVKRRTIHRMELEAFVGSAPPDMDALHRDGDQTNNDLSNLYWGSVSRNLADSVAHGTHFWAKRTECGKGHEYTPENTYIRTDGGARKCRRCMRDSGARRWQRVKEMQNVAAQNR